MFFKWTLFCAICLLCTLVSSPAAWADPQRVLRVVEQTGQEQICKRDHPDDLQYCYGKPIWRVLHFSAYAYSKDEASQQAAEHTFLTYTKEDVDRMLAEHMTHIELLRKELVEQRKHTAKLISTITTDEIMKQIQQSVAAKVKEDVINELKQQGLFTK